MSELVNENHLSDDEDYVVSDRQTNFEVVNENPSDEANNPQSEVSQEAITSNNSTSHILPEGTRRITTKPKRLNDHYCSFATSTGKSKATSYPMQNYLTYKKLSSSYVDFLDKVSTSVEPNSYIEASKNPLWVKAMNEEFAALEFNQTWDIVNKHPR